jgi:hypothetical protein
MLRDLRTVLEFTAQHRLRQALTPPLTLTEAEAARVVNFCPRTLRKARKAGQLRYILNGRAIRYTLADLADWIDSLRREGTAPCTAAPAPKSRFARPAPDPRRGSGEIIPFTARQRSQG